MLIVARPQIHEEASSPTRSRFVIEPLQPGFGYTLGNALRRTLLSSIPGAAISSVRMDGVLHEFSSIPKVTEDVTDIILNLKGLVLRSEIDEPVSAYLKAKGPGDVTAGDIQPPAGVEILNPVIDHERCSAGCKLVTLRRTNGPDGCSGNRLTFTVGPGESRATPFLDIDSEVPFVPSL